MYKAKEDFLWYKKGKKVNDKEVLANPNLLKHVEEVKGPSKKLDFDINKDGKVDEKDISLMASKLSKQNKKKSRFKKSKE